MPSASVAFLVPLALSTTSPSLIQHTAHRTCLHQKHFHPWIRSSSTKRSRPLPSVSATATNAGANASDWERDASTSARAHVNTPPPSGRPDNNDDEPTWRRVGACDVLLPAYGATPRAVIFFIGGLGAGAAPQSLYGNLLRRICESGTVAIIAYRLPPVPGTDHHSAAVVAADALSEACDAVLPREDDGDSVTLPAIGLGHSMGCKLLLLACVAARTRNRLRIDGNIFLAFSNASFRDAVPDVMRDAVPSRDGSRRVRDGLRLVRAFLDDWDIPASPPSSTSTSARVGRDSISGVIDSVANAIDAFAAQSDTEDNVADFNPTRDETLALVATRYNVCDNALVKFSDDGLDDGAALRHILETRFGSRGMLVWRELLGTHVTPVSPDFSGGTFASMGDEKWDERVRGVGLGVQREVEGVVAVVVAFVRLEIELVEKRKRQG